MNWRPRSPRYLTWTPANGDRFYIPRPEIAESEFLVSDMVVELVTQKGESRFHFNGTVEWALDSVESSGVVWLPREDQLRELLGRYFLSLDSSAGGFVVTVSGPGRAYHTEPEPDAADAYARAALYVLGATDRLSRPRRCRRRGRRRTAWPARRGRARPAGGPAAARRTPHPARCRRTAR